MGNFSGELRLYTNIGTSNAPVFSASAYTPIGDGSYNLYPRLFDLDRNGKPDFIRSINWGNIDFWLNPSNLAQLNDPSGTLDLTDPAGNTVNIKPLTDGAIIDIADLNADGVLDLICGGHAGNRIFIAYGAYESVEESIAVIESIYDAHPTQLGAALAADGGRLLDEIKTSEHNILFHMNSASFAERQLNFAALSDHVRRYPFLQMTAPLDPVEYNHLPSIAGQNLMLLHEMLPDTPTHRTRVADAVGLSGLHREIYLDTGLHIGDNQEATLGQLESIQDFMRLQPRESFPDAALTLNHYYGNGRGGWVTSFRGSKNTFNFGEGNNISEWASDLQAAISSFYGSQVYRGDYFTFVMGHEVTHSLDGYIDNRANFDLARRKGQMLTLAAGPDILSANGDNNDYWSWDVTKERFLAKAYWDGNNATWDQAFDAYWETGPGSAFKTLAFMRLDIPFFLRAPQEALATQANHHWAHSEARLTGAIDRYRRGIAEGNDPMKANITEVLTFLDYISCGMNKIVMQNTTGEYSPYRHAKYETTHAWVERNEWGYITKLTTSGRTYEFEVDDYGIVTDLIQIP